MGVVIAASLKSLDQFTISHQASRLHPRKHGPDKFDILRLKSHPIGPVITFVKTDFDEKDLIGLLRDVRFLSVSNEYSLFSGVYRRKTVNFLGTGSGSASLLTALFEITPSRIEYLVRIGASGGLKRARICEIVNVKTAFCMDTVSRTLSRAGRVNADPTIVRHINDMLARDKIESVIENAGSVDAMYLFERNIKRAETQGAYCWDLETATTLAFGRRFNVKSASVLQVVSDKNGNSIGSYPPIRKLNFVLSVLDALTI